ISSFTTTHPIEYTTNTSDELVVGGYQIFGSPGTISSSGGSSILKIATGDIRHIVYDDIATATTDDLVCTSASNANASAFLISYERSGGSGPITGNITQVTENESLFNMQIDLDVSVGQVTENESLFGPTADTSDSIAVGQVTENESVFDPTFESSVSILINQVTENESMFGATLDSGATVDITQVVENESVFNPAVVSTVSVSIAQINETESLFTVDPLQGDIVLVGQVTENESVFSGSIDIDLLLGLLTEEERVFGATIPGLITYLNINDAILGKTGGPTIADGLATWFSKGANESLQDAERRWLLSFGATTSGTNQDLWNQYLTSLGYSGTFNDKYLEYWKNV
ncbi:MAG: hypothetical protein KJO91_04195, partial [Gammaproteobacteria bacterium]|nr:hypothetical protein [Gammaproteobacteria bacterium]